MRVSKFLLHLLAFACAVAASTECDVARGSAPSSAACRGRKRSTYVHVDTWEMTMTNGDFIQYIKDFATAGASHILLGRVVPAFGGVINSAGQFGALSPKETADVTKFLKEQGAKLLITIGGGFGGCPLSEMDAWSTARKWCKYARDMGYNGVNWNLESVNAQTKDHPQVQWLKHVADHCHDYVDLVTLSAPIDLIGESSDSAFAGILEASLRPTDRILLQFPNRPKLPSLTDTGKLQTEASLLASIEAKLPSAKNKLVIGKYLYEYGGPGRASTRSLVQRMEQAEVTGYTGGLMLFKAPPKGTAHLTHLLKSLLPQVSGVHMEEQKNSTTPKRPETHTPPLLIDLKASTQAKPPSERVVLKAPAVAQIGSAKPREKNPQIRRRPSPSVKQPTAKPTSRKAVGRGRAQQQNRDKPKKGDASSEGGQLRADTKAEQTQTSDGSTTPLVQSTSKANGLPEVDCTKFKHYEGFMHQPGHEVVYKKSLWRMKMYTMDPPRRRHWGWTKIGRCKEATPVSRCTQPAWVPTKYYIREDTVTYQGATYISKFATTPDNVPDRQYPDVWVYLYDCIP